MATIGKNWNPEIKALEKSLIEAIENSNPKNKEAGEVGTYALLRKNSGTTFHGQVVSGSQLKWATASGIAETGMPQPVIEGQWKLMGFAQDSGASTPEDGTAVWLRVE
ncbi:hypothetical protein [Idiomarina sp.]|uniref:hypothetical protein n=1 Tax=Idiomarina sp. TaxID=1874361 RepID=UPI00258B4AFA|nr:hypothetical protein [Idiomarina sp.]